MLIQYEIGTEDGRNTNNRTHRYPEKRWAVRKLDKDRFMETIAGSTWMGEDTNTNGKVKDMNEEAMELREIMTLACNSVMPKVKPQRKRGVAW